VTVRWRNPSTQSRETYTSWVNMRLRCANEKHPLWVYYGARGIKVCPEWIDYYDNFYEHMGYRPKGTTLDRIDNNKGYEPGNCRWATMAVQNRNNRKTRMITHNGRTQPMADWADELGIGRAVLRKRLENYPVARALDPTSLIGVPQHGTLTMYVGYRCRCEPCVLAHREYARSRSKARA